MNRRASKGLRITVGYFLVLVLCGFVAAPSFASEFPQDSNPVIARLWLERSYKLINGTTTGTPDWTAAADAWRIASDFQAPGRDALYLRTRLILSDNDPLGSPDDVYSFGKYRRAYTVLSRSWEMQKPDIKPDIVDFEERSKLWAALALRNREYRALIRQFESWPRAYHYQSELLYAVSRASLYLGLNDKAAGFAGRGESLSEASTKLEFLDTDYGPALPAFRAISIAAGDIQAIQTLSAARRKWGSEIQDRALLPWVLSGNIPARTLKDLPIQYSTFLDASLNLILAMDNTDSVAISGLLEEASLQDDFAILRRLESSRKAEITESIGEYSGEFISDADYDGFPEEKIKIVAGKPVSRRIDENQDGRDEWLIDYRNGAPLRIRLAVENASMSVNFEDSAYPSVFSISRIDPSASYDISFNPGEFFWSPLDSENFFLMPDLPDWQESNIWQAARTVVVKYRDAEGWTAQARSTLAGGYPLRAEETRFTGQAGNEKDWTRQLLYQDGVPVAGRLSYRSDPENPLIPLWEVYERYESGTLVGIAWMPQSRAQAFFLHDWALRGILETQAWNMDNNPWIDVRRLLFPGVAHCLL